MYELIRIILDLAVQVGPYFAVFAIFGYIARVREKKDKEREEEQRKGIVRTCYVVKTEKVLTIIFIVALILFGWGTIASAIQQEDLFPPIVLGILCLISLAGSLNMIMWKLEVNGDEITWRSTFGRKRVSAKYSCGFPDPQVLPIIVVDRYLDYFTTIMEDRLWQVLAKPVFRWRNRSGLSMNAARAA